ncbi:MAG: DEAD/DEAH box helicase [Burkholderiales bacterium]|jgi:ATP-dependent RNA helicase RhlE|nr:DEAD/DEAH box helicase [Burkholderiales bacterium]
MSFASLGLSDALVRAVADVGYTAPTPIQLQAIPTVLAGHDLLAGAQTGTGKTAGFVLPILQRLLDAPRQGKKHIRVLILTPTRELAAQVEESVRVYGKHTDLTSSVIFGGVNINPQITALRQGFDVLVATPGRLLDHHGQKTIDLSHVEVLVLDEADRMLDMGFIHDIKRVLRILPPKRQNLLFSATFSDEIRDLANGLLNQPKHIQVTPRNSTVESVAQRVIAVDAKRKPELLLHLVKEGNWYQVLVFTRTKHGANKLAQQLDKAGVPALPIHGNKSQNARTRALAEFKSGKLQVLVATDIAARGIDIDNLPHVVNFDLPNVPEDYVHRIGRTGRAGMQGEALSLVSPDEMSYLRDIEKLIRRALPREVIPGFEKGTAPQALPVTPRAAGAEAAAATTEQQPRRDGARQGERGGRRGAGSGNGARRSGAKQGATKQAEHKQVAHKSAPQRDSERSAAPHKQAVHKQGEERGEAQRKGGHAPAPASTRAQRPHDPSRDGLTGRSSARPPRREADTAVRANLPPGWPGSTSGRR